MKGVIKIPVCQSCKKEWTWKQTIKRTFRLKCPHCGSKQYESASSKKKGSLFILFVLIPLPINVLFDLSISVALVLSVIVALIMISIYPFVLKLSNEEEPLF